MVAGVRCFAAGGVPLHGKHSLPGRGACVSASATNQLFLTRNGTPQPLRPRAESLSPARPARELALTLEPALRAPRFPARDLACRSIYARRRQSLSGSTTTCSGRHDGSLDAARGSSPASQLRTPPDSNPMKRLLPSQKP